MLQELATIDNSINKFATVDVSVDCVIFGFDNERLNILLIETKIPDIIKHAGIKRFALPGDLIFENEDLDDAAKRVLKELTNIEGIYLKQFYTFSDPDRLTKEEIDRLWLKNFRENPDARVITTAYYSLVKMEEFEPSASSFANEAIWLDIKELPRLAFDHTQIFNKALQVLRHEIVNSDIAFELLPEKFTLSQLQLLHEIVLNKKLDKRNFRKSIKKLDQVVPLPEKEQGVMRKPGQLFKFQADFY